MASQPIPQPGAGAGQDPSMDDILASIRRILNEDEAAKPAAPANQAPSDDVLVLDSSMMLPEPQPDPPPLPPEHTHAEPVQVTFPQTPEPPPPAPQPPPAARELPALVAPEAAAAAASSVGALLRTLATERSTATHRNGPTIEDLVRDEMRPLLKEWLDNHLPPMVERLVRVEIERVVSRMAQ